MGEGGRSGGQGSPRSRYRRLGYGLDRAHRRVNAASKGIERSSYLRSADSERRRHAYGRSSYQVHENALIETVLENFSGEVGVGEVEPEQEALAPYLRAWHPLRKLLERVPQNGPLEPHLFEEGRVVHHA